MTVAAGELGLSARAAAFDTFPSPSGRDGVGVGAVLAVAAAAGVDNARTGIAHTPHRTRLGHTRNATDGTLVDSPTAGPNRRHIAAADKNRGKKEERGSTGVKRDKSWRVSNGCVFAVGADKWCGCGLFSGCGGNSLICTECEKRTIKMDRGTRAGERGGGNEKERRREHTRAPGRGAAKYQTTRRK
jgi:hypothetical protein